MCVSGGLIKRWGKEETDERELPANPIKWPFFWLRIKYHVLYAPTFCERTGQELTTGATDYFIDTYCTARCSRL